MSLHQSVVEAAVAVGPFVGLVAAVAAPCGFVWLPLTGTVEVMAVVLWFSIVLFLKNCPAK